MNGLSSEEAHRRLSRDGKNELPKKQATSWMVILARQFANAMIAVLLVAAVITFFLNEISDTIVIVIAILINVIIGFVQEYRAEHALAALLTVIAEEATVIRDGTRIRIPRSDVVIGDVLILSSGDRVAADARVLQATEFEVNESILTGESLPQGKNMRRVDPKARLGERTNIVYAGTVVTRGNATAVVVSTGITTEIGGIASQLQLKDQGQTPLQQKLSRFSGWIATIVVVIAVCIVALGVVINRSWIEMFTVAVALAVAAIPEGLVVGVTAILAIGMHRLLRCNALVRRLLAAETLGSTTVICTDKTGTLTEGDMRLGSIITLDETVDVTTAEYTSLSKEMHEIVVAALATNESVVEHIGKEMRVFGSPTERGILIGLQEIGAERSKVLEGVERTDLIPFSSDRKYSGTVHPHGRGSVLYVVGAPDRLLERATHHVYHGTHKRMSSADRSAWETIIQKHGGEGWRMIAVTSRLFSKPVKRAGDDATMVTRLTMLGLIALRDPIREGAKDMIRAAADAGVRTIMITGDHRTTAAHIGKTLGLPTDDGHIVEGRELTSYTDAEVAERIGKVSIYARMVPSEKVRIVAALQNRGDVVAMTGDGVNDAPALKNADIGIAVGTATDVAKEAADMVILDNNFGTIVRAIQEGRVIMENVRKVALYLLSDSFAQVILILLSLVFGVPLPLLAAQILWINLVSDGFPDLALTLDPGDPDVMREKPIAKNASLLDTEYKWLIGTMSAVMGIGNFLLFLWLLQTGDVDRARSVIFVAMGLSTIAVVFSCRSVRRPVWRTNLLSNSYLLVAVTLGAAIQISSVTIPALRDLLKTVPLHLEEWGLVIVVVVAYLAVIEGMKGSFEWYRRWMYGTHSH